jgi:hypothetical protein
VEGGGSHREWHMVFHALTRVGHAPTSKIYSQARVRHAPACSGQMEKRMMVERSGGSPYYGGVARACGGEAL